MKRLLWLGVGLAIGAVVVRVVTKKAQAYTPRGIAAAVRDSGRNALDSVRDFVDDVRDGMHEREQELHEAFLEGRAFDDRDDLEGLRDLEDFESGDLDEAGFDDLLRDTTEDNAR